MLPDSVRHRFGNTYVRWTGLVLLLILAVATAAVSFYYVQRLAAASKPAAPPAGTAKTTPSAPAPPTARVSEAAASTFELPAALASIGDRVVSVAVDRSNGQLWLVTTDYEKIVLESRLHRYDPATGALRSWVLPGKGAEGDFVFVAVNRSGLVGGGWQQTIVRFDPPGPRL